MSAFATLISAGGGGHYQTFDPALRIAPTLKLRAIVGDEVRRCRSSMTTSVERTYYATPVSDWRDA
jgi:hypothetical protein